MKQTRQTKPKQMEQIFQVDRGCVWTAHFSGGNHCFIFFSNGFGALAAVAM